MRRRLAQLLHRLANRLDAEPTYIIQTRQLTSAEVDAFGRQLAAALRRDARWLR